MSEINLIGGFYQAKSLPFSAQDTVNWLPVPAKVEGARSPIKLRGLPGLRPIGESVISALTITGDAPNTVVDAAYSYSYTVNGGTPPYSYNISSGSLPDGLSFALGSITGTSTTAQLREFRVTVMDSLSQTAFVDDEINVLAGTPPFPIVASQTPTVSGALLTTQTANYPSAVDSGDLLIYVVSANKGLFDPGGVNVNISTPSGLTKLQGGKPGGNTKSDTGIYYRVATGVEAGGTVAFSLGDSAYFTCVIYRILAGTYSGTPTASTEVRSTDSAPNIASHNSGLAINALFLVAVAGETQTGASTLIFPYADNQAQNYSGGANQTFVSSCTLNSTGGGSVSSIGNEFTLSAVANSYVYTLSIGRA